MQLPEHVRGYITLPSILREDRQVYDPLKVSPMRWSHAVIIVQHVHRFVKFQLAYLPEELHVENSLSPTLGVVRFFMYIDDSFQFENGC